MVPGRVASQLPRAAIRYYSAQGNRCIVSGIARPYERSVTMLPAPAGSLSALCRFLVSTANRGAWVGLAALAGSAFSAAAVTPIARWDVVPHQRIKQSEGLRCGVIAFSKAGIARVTFRVNDQLRHVTSMHLNGRTGVYEYWTPIAAGDHPEGGSFQIGATAYGNDGGKRALPPLALVSNPNGSLPRREAWVDADDGDDGAGVTGDPQRPFATIGRAMDGIRLWMKAQGHGDRADGGIVRLRPGNHAMSNGGIWREIRTVDHFVMWHCSLLGQSLNFYDDKAGDSRLPLSMTNVSVVGCCFGNVKKHTQGGHVDLSGFESNHIVMPEGIHSVTPGSDVSTGDPMLTAEGTPRRRSPLVNRLTRRLVPTDAEGRVRDARPDVGACELITPD